MRAQLILRVRILSVFFVLVAIILFVRLYIVQVVHGDSYRKEATGQYIVEAPDIQDRGDIFFTLKDGSEVAAAVMQSGWRIAIQPRVMTDPESVYKALSEVVDVDKERFFNSAAKKDDPYEEVAFRIDDKSADAIRAKELEGVLLVRDEWRRYPGQELAAHVVGFVGFKGDRKEGVYGIERYYQDTLKRSSADLYVNPFAEIFTNVAAAVSGTNTAREGSVITTIEPNVETQLERILSDVVEKYQPRRAGGIVMDPKTGDIVAMAVLPTFDPNTYNTVPDASVFTNPMVEGVYEMGSIMKPLTMAAGIDVGAVTPETTYDDLGCVSKSGSRVCNFDGRGRGVVDMQEVLSQSLNTGVSFVVDQMGKEAFATYMRAYGLGEETGIDLPNEIAGNIKALDGNSDIDFASASFGQSIAVTPIAMIRALAALANHGILAEPHVGKAIRYPSGAVKEVPQAPEQRVFKEETAETVTRMLSRVFDDALLGGIFKQERYSIAAKTGTAQIATPECGGYCDGRFLHSFFGYFPAHDARFIVFLFAIEPHGELYASHTLAYPFFDMTKFLINYYDIPPDR